MSVGLPFKYRLSKDEFMGGGVDKFGHAKKHHLLESRIMTRLMEFKYIYYNDELIFLNGYKDVLMIWNFFGKNYDSMREYFIGKKYFQIDNKTYFFSPGNEKKAFIIYALHDICYNANKLSEWNTFARLYVTFMKDTVWLLHRFNDSMIRDCINGIIFGYSVDDIFGFCIRIFISKQYGLGILHDEQMEEFSKIVNDIHNSYSVVELKCEFDQIYDKCVKWLNYMINESEEFNSFVLEELNKHIFILSK
jgi:hypothetical protein